MTDRNPAYDGLMGVFTDYEGCDTGVTNWHPPIGSCPSCSRPDGQTSHGAPVPYREGSRENICWLCYEFFIWHISRVTKKHPGQSCPLPLTRQETIQVDWYAFEPRMLDHAQARNQRSKNLRTGEENYGLFR